MHFILWSLPAVTIVTAIGTGRVNPTMAALLGLLIAVPVAVLSGRHPVGPGLLALSLARGAWIGATILPYILGGLFFWQVAAHPPSASCNGNGPSTDVALGHAVGSALAKRRLVFFACFLVGPFAESATGFGVGMLGTVMLIRGLGMSPRHLMILALLSQTMIPWGAMSSGTLLASAYAHMPPRELGLYSMVPIVLLAPVWLCLFWRTIRHAGLLISARECLRESVWITGCLGLLTLAVSYVGPETSLLAAYGSLIALRYIVDYRPDRKQALTAARRAIPYTALIGALVLVQCRISGAPCRHLPASRLSATCHVGRHCSTPEPGSSWEAS